MTSRSSSLAKPLHRPAHPTPESRLRRGAEQPAARTDVDRRAVPPPAVLVARGGPLIPASLRLDMIRDAAYFRAEARGFAPGKEIEDWMAAEQDVDELILRRYGG
jgi:Protein of unknown function (DUF2934)